MAHQCKLSYETYPCKTVAIMAHGMEGWNWAAVRNSLQKQKDVFKRIITVTPHTYIVTNASLLHHALAPHMYIVTFHTSKCELSVHRFTVHRIQCGQGENSAPPPRNGAPPPSMAPRSPCRIPYIPPR